MDFARQALEKGLELGVGLAFAQELAPGLELFAVAVETLQQLGAALETAPPAHHRRALDRIVPEARDLHLTVDGGELIVEAGILKDTP